MKSWEIGEKEMESLLTHIIFSFISPPHIYTYLLTNTHTHTHSQRRHSLVLCRVVWERKALKGKFIKNLSILQIYYYDIYLFFLFYKFIFINLSFHYQHNFVLNPSF